MGPTTTYDRESGWVGIDDVLTAAHAADLAVDCARLADELIEIRPGDKPHGATRRLTALEERLPETAEIARTLAPVVDQILPNGWVVSEIAWRCPGPGTGDQRLHADDVPRMDPGSPDTGVTALVALVPFTSENGATRVVPGSHLRIDQQRQSQQLAQHPDEIHLVGEVGTAFVFTRHLLHAGSLNRSSAPRPALQISYRSLEAQSLESAAMGGW